MSEPTVVNNYYAKTDDTVEAYYRGKFEERDRIISLLQEQECDCDSDECNGWAVGDIEPLIALIKGDNK